MLDPNELKDWICPQCGLGPWECDCEGLGDDEESEQKWNENDERPY